MWVANSVRSRYRQEALFFFIGCAAQRCSSLARGPDRLTGYRTSMPYLSGGHPADSCRGLRMMFPMKDEPLVPRFRGVCVCETLLYKIHQRIHQIPSKTMPLWLSVLIVYNASLLSGQFDSENCSKPFLEKSINLDAFVLSNYQPIPCVVVEGHWENCLLLWMWVLAGVFLSGGRAGRVSQPSAGAPEGVFQCWTPPFAGHHASCQKLRALGSSPAVLPPLEEDKNGLVFLFCPWEISKCQSTLGVHFVCAFSLGRCDCELCFLL